MNQFQFQFQFHGKRTDLVALRSQLTLLDGAISDINSGQINEWHYAIGAVALFGGGIPVPVGSTNTVSVVELWLWMTELSLPPTSCSKFQFLSFVLLIFLFIPPNFRSLF
jgi:hypothetical protein